MNKVSANQIELMTMIIKFSYANGKTTSVKMLEKKIYYNFQKLIVKRKLQIVIFGAIIINAKSANKLN